VKAPYRRKILLGGALLAVGGIAAAGWRTGLPLPARLPEFAPMPALPGYRLLKGGPLTPGGVPLFGLEQPPPAGLEAARGEVARDLCGALFGDALGVANAVPVAYFFDFQCPVCRRLSPRLRRLEGIAISWHDLAGLGPASEVAARAAIAARAQGAGDAFHDRLMRARFQPNEAYVKALAEGMGLDVPRLLEDMASDAVERRMWLSRALAGKLGMAGTPGLVIGRTVIIGDQPDKLLRRIVAVERAEPGPCGLRP